MRNLQWPAARTNPFEASQESSWAAFSSAYKVNGVSENRVYPCIPQNSHFDGVKLQTVWTDESRGGKSKRREEKKKEDQRREKVRRNKIKGREKVEKSRVAVFCQSCVAPEGRKIGSL